MIWRRVMPMSSSTNKHSTQNFQIGTTRSQPFGKTLWLWNVWWNIFWWNDMNAVNMNYIVQFLPCPQVTWDTIPRWVIPIYHKKCKSFNFEIPSWNFRWSTTFDLPSGHTTTLGTMPRPHNFRWDSQFWVASKTISIILASNFMNIKLLDVTSTVCGEKSPPCAVVATSSITINMNIVKSIKRQI